jgi:sulfur-carrier protein
MATIKIPPVLRASVGGEKQVSATGGNVGDVLKDLAANHPATQDQLFSADGELNRYVNVYLNDEDVRVLDGLETTVGESDTLVILPAMAGGACASSVQLIKNASVADRSSGLAKRKP